MSREYGKKLTKQMLKDFGIEDIHYLPDFGEKSSDPKEDWYISRLWKKSGTGQEKVYKRIKVTEAVCKHKYTVDKKYLKITFSVNKKIYSIPLSRVIYAWFVGDIEDKEVIDHIDNNPFNNYPTNLQKLSVGKNLAKRFIDNPYGSRNQYTTDKYILLNKCYKEGKSYEEALAMVEKLK